MEEIETSRKRKADENLQRRELAKAQRLGTAVEDEDDADMDEDLTDGEDEDEAEDVEPMDEDGDDNDRNPMAALLASAQARVSAYNNEPDDDDMDGIEVDDDDETDEWGGIDETAASQPARKDSSRRAFDKVFKDVVEASDVVLYVLDARDPLSTRSKDVEKQVMAAAADAKRLILILNKIDLIPAQNLKDWLTYLRRSFPTLPLRASSSAANARTFDHKALTVKGTSESLLRALKAYAHSSQLKRAITVGVIGYPNVGKSSVINALTSRLGNKGAACPVGAEAGVTTGLREVKIDNKLKLLDSPGIVFPSATGNGKMSKVDQQARLILLNAIPPKEIEDPVPAVALLLKQLQASTNGLRSVMDLYGLVALAEKDGQVTTDFLVQVARKRGRLGKGGIPNMHAAAQTVVTDWRDGRIQGWSEVPALPGTQTDETAAGTASSVHDGLVGEQKQVVSEWAKEFELEGLWGGSEN